MEVYIVLASISYLWPFEVVEVVGGNMVKKQDFGSEKKTPQNIYPTLGHFPAVNGSKSSKGLR